MNGGVIGDVVAVVLQRRRVEGEQPDRRDAEVLKVVELPGEAAKVADAVAVAVVEGAHVELVDDRILVPARTSFRGQGPGCIAYHAVRHAPFLVTMHCVSVSAGS